MSHIFKELNEIPIPPDCYVNRHDARVFIILRSPGAKNKRIVIGRATSTTTMHPNENFRYHYPTLWEQYFGKKELRPHRLHCGIYALSLGFGWKTQLYPLLIDAFGPLYANSAMDYAMFSIMDRTNTTELYPDRMSHEFTFAREIRSDEWYSRAFKNGFGEDAIFNFKKAWLQACAAEQCKKVWLCVDGSNNDCSSQKCDLAEHGAAKSHKNIDIVSYIYAVDAESGKPITWFVNNGGMPDCKAINEVVQYLATSNIAVKGLILDRGFCSQKCLDDINAAGYQYVLMLKQSTEAYKTLYTQLGNDIRWKMNKVVSADGIFGATAKTNIFKNSAQQDTVGLFFDGTNGAARMGCLIKKVVTAYEQAQAQLILDNKTAPTIPTELKSFVVTSKDESGRYRVEYNYEHWQKTGDEKGYSAVATSLDAPAAEINRLYNLRDKSEKQFSTLKTQLGSKVTRVFERSSIEAKFAVAFIASILRYEIEKACQNIKLDTNKMIKEMDRLVIELLPNNMYTPIENYSKRQMDLLTQAGIYTSIFAQIAAQANDSGAIQSQTRKIEPIIGKRGRGRPPKPKEESPVAKEEDKNPKKRGGRKKGSKNKKTLIKEAIIAQQPPQPKRSPGRPKGSKNKKTLERERLAVEQKTKESRGRGRPKGSKNKKTIERELLQRSRPPVEKRKPGRPIGSRNKR